MGVEVYEHQPVLDVAQNLRAASLAGLAPIDSGLACIYATKFLGEADTSHFNCEPAMTAIDVLVAHNHRLPIYQFLLLRGRDFVPQAKGEVVGKALESLGRDFPSSLYIPLAQNYLELDVPIVTIGVINHIIENRVAGLYAMLENIISETRHWDLHRAAVISLAASRDETLWALLYRMAKFAPEKYVANFIEAVELTYGAERDVVLRLLALTPNPSPKGRGALMLALTPTPLPRGEGLKAALCTLLLPKRKNRLPADG
jgi:hypothetical protein